MSDSDPITRLNAALEGRYRGESAASKHSASIRFGGGRFVPFYVMPYVEGESLRGKLDREHQLHAVDKLLTLNRASEGIEENEQHHTIRRTHARSRRDR